MSAEEVRDQLGNSVLMALLHLRTEKGPYSGEAALEVADALLPTVRHIAADELRSVADLIESIDSKAALLLRTRAAALDPTS